MSWLKIFSGLLVVCLPASCQGQKPDEQESWGIFQTRGEYHQFMGSVKQSVAANPEMKSMIAMINDIVLEQPFGTTSGQYGISDGTLGLLADPGVRSEIEMVDEQYEDLQRLNSDIQRRLAEQIRSLDFAASDGVVSQIRKLRDQAEGDLNAVLLPHQLYRLRQLRTQSQLRYRGIVDLLTSEPMRAELEISAQQSRDLRVAEKEIEAELEEEIARLREEARKKLLSTLSRRQQEKVDQIFGEAFEFSAANGATEKRGKRASGK